MGQRKIDIKALIRKNPQQLRYGYIRAAYKEGCHPELPYDNILVEMKNIRGEVLNFCLTPDEAILLSTQLLAAVLETQYHDEHFIKRYVAPRVKEVQKYASRTRKDKKNIPSKKQVRRAISAKRIWSRMGPSAKKMGHK